MGEISIHSGRSLLIPASDTHLKSCLGWLIGIATSSLPPASHHYCSPDYLSGDASEDDKPFSFPLHTLSETMQHAHYTVSAGLPTRYIAAAWP